MKLGSNHELGPVPESVLRRLSIPAPSAESPVEGGVPPLTRSERPLRLAQSPAAQELLCLLDTQPTEPDVWRARLHASISAEFNQHPKLLCVALQGLDTAAGLLLAKKPADRERALADLDALVFALLKAKQP